MTDAELDEMEQRRVPMWNGREGHDPVDVAVLVAEVRRLRANYESLNATWLVTHREKVAELRACLETAMQRWSLFAIEDDSQERTDYERCKRALESLENAK